MPEPRPDTWSDSGAPTASTIAVVIPALDEASTIAEVVRRALTQPVEWVIVADNGSTDDTARVATAAGAIVVAEPVAGYGRACTRGSLEAQKLGATVIVYLDGDGSSRPEELPLLVAPITADEADLVLGSRTLGHIARGSMGPHQRFGNLLSAALMRMLYDVQVTDLGPYRAIRTELLTRLDMEEMTFGWPTEMMVKSANGGARIVEIAVAWDHRAGGRSKVSGTLRGSVLAARHILGVTLRHAKWRQRRRSGDAPRPNNGDSMQR